MWTVLIVSSLPPLWPLVQKLVRAMKGSRVWQANVSSFRSQSQRPKSNGDGAATDAGAPPRSLHPFRRLESGQHDRELSSEEIQMSKTVTVQHERQEQTQAPNTSLSRCSYWVNSDVVAIRYEQGKKIPIVNPYAKSLNHVQRDLWPLLEHKFGRKISELKEWLELDYFISSWRPAFQLHRSFQRSHNSRPLVNCSSLAGALVGVDGHFKVFEDGDPTTVAIVSIVCEGILAIGWVKGFRWRAASHPVNHEVDAVAVAIVASGPGWFIRVVFRGKLCTSCAGGVSDRHIAELLTPETSGGDGLACEKQRGGGDDLLDGVHGCSGLERVMNWRNLKAFLVLRMKVVMNDWRTGLMDICWVWRVLASG